MKDFTAAMKALSDQNRVKIIKMLQHKSMCVCEIKAALNLPQPSVSKHLKILEKAGFVYSQKEGLWVNYHISDGSRTPYAATLLGNLRHWLDDDPEITGLVEKVFFLNRKDLCK